MPTRTPMRFFKHPLSMAIVVLSVQACGNTVAPDSRQSFSFEQGMDGWITAAADTGDMGMAHAPWAIVPTAELATDGRRSLKLFMANNTDAAKIWIVRAFPATPGRRYNVDVAYRFASGDWGDANQFLLLTGAFRTPPTDGPSLVAGTWQERTGNGAGVDLGFRWLEKSVRRSVETADSGVVYVVIGIWGTWEGARTYYLDDLTVTLTPAQ